MASEYTIDGKLVIDVSDFKKQLENLQQDVDNLKKKSEEAAKKTEDSWKKAGQTLTKFGSTMTKNFTLPIVGLGVAAVKLASDLDETMGKASVVFGDSYDAIDKWSDGSIESMGLAKESALAAAADFGNMATSMGLSQEASADLSMNMVQLGADLASFNNISNDRANIALKGIFTGEGEALKSLGINMNEANLETFAMNQGLGKTYKSMTQSEKAMLRYKYVVSQTKNAQGDFARTSDSVANKTRTLGERVKELGAKFGEKLLPIVSDVITYVTNLVKSFTDLSDSQQKTILWAAGIVAAIGPILTTLGKLSTAISGIGKLFGSPTGAATMGWVGLAVAAVAGIAAVAISIKTRYEEIHKESLAIKQAVSTFKNDMAEIETDFLGKKEDLLASAELAGTLLDRIDELEQGGLSSAAAQREHALAIEQLKRLFPQLDIAIDTNTGYIKGGTKAVRDNIDALVDQALAALLLEKQEEELIAVALAQLDLYQAQKKQAEFLKKNEDAITKYTRAEKGLADALGITTSEVRKMPWAELVKNYNSGSAEVKSFTTEIMKSKIESVDVIDEYHKLGDSVESFELALVDANGQIIITQQTMDELGVSATDAGNSIDDAGGKIPLTAEELKALAEAEAAAAKEAEDLKTAQDELKRVTEEYDAAVLQATDNIINNFEKMNMRSGVSLTKAVKNLKYNNEQIRLAMLNHQTLVDQGFGKDFLDHLYNMGPEGMRLLAEGVKNPTKLAELETAYNESGQLGAQEVTNGYTTKIATELKAANAKLAELSKAGGEAAGEAWADGSASKDEEVYLAQIGFGPKITEAQPILEEAATENGEKATTATAKAITDNDEEVTLAMIGFGPKITEAQPTLEEAGTDTGEKVTTATAKAVTDNDEEVTLAMIGFGPKITEAQPALEEAATETGEKVTAATSTAMTAKDEEVTLAMIGFGPKMDEAKTGLVSIATGIGSDIGQGVANGIDSKIGAVKAAARRLANAATSSMKVTAEIKSPSKKTAKEVGMPMAQGLVVGFEDGMKKMMGRIKTSTNSIIGGLSTGSASAASQTKSSAQSAMRSAITGKSNASVIQNNTFTSKELSPYEQRVQLKRLDNDLAEVFA